MNRTSIQGKGGFSLTEMVVVIAVLVLLAALIIPAITKVRDYALRVESIANIRRISDAMLLFALEHEDRFPIAYMRNSSPVREWAYPSQILPYLYDGESNSLLGSYPVSIAIPNSKNIFISPSATIPMGRESSRHWIVTTYSMHRGLGSRYLEKQPTRSQIVRPSEVILIGEGVQGAGGSSAFVFEKPNDVWRNMERISDEMLNTVIPEDPVVEGTQQSMGWISYRTSGKAVMAYADGHVELVSRGTVRYRNIAWDR